MAETTVMLPLVVDAKEAARLCGVGASHWWGLHAAGRCPLPVKLGRRTLWRVDELRRWLAAGCPARSAWLAAEKGPVKR